MGHWEVEVHSLQQLPPASRQLTHIVTGAIHIEKLWTPVYTPGCFHHHIRLIHGSYSSNDRKFGVCQTSKQYQISPQNNKLS